MPNYSHEDLVRHLRSMHLTYQELLALKLRYEQSPDESRRKLVPVVVEVLRDVPPSFFEMPPRGDNNGR